MRRLPFLSRLKPEQLDLLGQLVRYAITGGGITVMHLTIYYVLAGAAHLVSPQIANIIAQFFSTSIGYVIHSRWSFKGHGRRDNLARSVARFLMVTAIGYSINVFWVWLFTDFLNGPVWWPMPFMAVLTPLTVFYLNRRWVFA